MTKVGLSYNRPLREPPCIFINYFAFLLLFYHFQTVITSKPGSSSNSVRAYAVNDEVKDSDD